MSLPLITTIIGAYNAGRYLGEAIESVLAQTHPRLELIVVDDGSTDATGRIAESYGDPVRCIRQENGGMAAARNRAIPEARGDYLAFLDADDRFPPDKLRSQLAVFEAQPELDIVYGHVTEFLSPDLDEAARALLRAPEHDVPWPTPNLMLVKRESFLRVGLFSTELKVGIGVDWYARANELGLRSAVPPIVVLERRLHAENNGIRQRESKPQYLHVLKAALDRRRAEA
ncbi:MAG TPA: glycosyltransferase family A protein [Gaiellaceae bacterium]|jgi:glycosyltransferase involved in cell wall biosynthesis|nr:glycosyltransferase family A protein [Gaiellaceae bacterium]